MVTKTPDLASCDRAAWKLRKLDPPPVPDQAATLAGWLVKFPGAHPAWDHWAVFVIHLRDIPGQTQPPVVTLPGASHEFTFAAIDPDCEIDPDVPSGMRYLVPIDLCHQVVGLLDDDAVRICESVVRAMVIGAESPDSDYRRAWCAKLDATAAHFRSGAHAMH